MTRAPIHNVSFPVVAHSQLYVDPRNRKPPALPPAATAESGSAYPYRDTEALAVYMCWFEVPHRYVRDTRYQVECWSAGGRGTDQHNNKRLVENHCDGVPPAPTHKLLIKPG